MNFCLFLLLIYIVDNMFGPAFVCDEMEGRGGGWWLEIPHGEHNPYNMKTRMYVENIQMIPFQNHFGNVANLRFVLPGVHIQKYFMLNCK